MRGLPAGVWLLGAVSLLNDVASDAVYPLLPFFLTTGLGATAGSLVIEGAAEAVSSVLKSCRARCPIDGEGENQLCNPVPRSADLQVGRLSSPLKRYLFRPLHLHVGQLG